MYWWLLSFLDNIAINFHRKKNFYVFLCFCRYRYRYSKCFYRYKVKWFSSLLYSFCKGLNCFFLSETQKKIYPMVRKKRYLSPPPLKNGHSWMTFERSLCFMQILARSKKVKDSALKSICFFFSRKCHIHSWKYICTPCRNFKLFSPMA